MHKKKTWTEKFNNPGKDIPKIVDIPLKMEKRLGKGKMVIAHPKDFDNLIRKVKKGKLITYDILMKKLAEKYNVKTTCPITTGIFVKIVAEKAEEDLKNGKKNITPYWRVIKSDGSLNDKFPGGVEKQKLDLEAEGFIIEKKGKKYKVKDFEKYITK